MPPLAKIQLGKNGLTENFIQTLKSHFEKHTTVKVSVLKSAERKMIQDYRTKMLKELGPNYTAKIIGFIITLKRWRKPQKF